MKERESYVIVLPALLAAELNAKASQAGYAHSTPDYIRTLLLAHLGQEPEVPKLPPPKFSPSQALVMKALVAGHTNVYDIVSAVQKPLGSVRTLLHVLKVTGYVETEQGVTGHTQGRPLNKYFPTEFGRVQYLAFKTNDEAKVRQQMDANRKMAGYEMGVLERHLEQQVSESVERMKLDVGTLVRGDEILRDLVGKWVAWDERKFDTVAQKPQVDALMMQLHKRVLSGKTTAVDERDALETSIAKLQSEWEVEEQALKQFERSSVQNSTAAVTSEGES